MKVQHAALLRAAAWVALVVALAFYVQRQVIPLLDDMGLGVTGAAAHSNDYKHIYLGSEILFSGYSPYDPELMKTIAGEYYMREDFRFRTILPYVYLPFTGFALRPVTLLPFAQSVVAFQILNHVLLLGGLLLAAWASGWWKPREAPWPLALAVAAVAFNATVFRQNTAGQLNVILLFGMAVLYTGIVRQWHAAAIGFVAAFLMLFKLSPGIFLIWFLLRREWSRAAWMAGWALAMTVVTVVVFGLRVHMDYLPVLQEMGYGKSTWAGEGMTFWRDPYNQSFNALFHRLLVPHEGSGISPWMQLPASVANGLTMLVSLGILGGMVWACSRRAPGEESPAALNASFSVAVCASLLIPSIMWDHYLVQGLLPGVLLMAVVVQGGARPWVVGGLTVLAIGAASLYIALDGAWFRQGFPLLLMSVKLLTPILLYGLAVWILYEEGRARDERRTG